MLTNWLCLQEWEFAGCISVLEEQRKGKGGKEACHFCQGLLIVLPYWAEGMIKPPGKEDLEAGPLKKAVRFLCMCVCVCRHLCASELEELFMWVEATSFSDVILSIWDCLCVGVCYCTCVLKIADASKMFSFCVFAFWQLHPYYIQKQYPIWKCLFSASLAVKTLYLAMNKYFSSETVTSTHRTTETQLFYISYVTQGFKHNLGHCTLGSCVTRLYIQYAFTTWRTRLTVTPYITLVCVRPIQDRFKSHPFYWYLWNENLISQTL